MYMRLAALRALLQPFRSPLASSRLARAIVAAKADFRRSSSCFIEAAVGCRSSCAATDWRAVNPAIGFPADSRMAVSNCAMEAVQGPAWAQVELKTRTALTTAAATRSLDISLFAFSFIATSVAEMPRPNIDQR